MPSSTLTALAAVTDGSLRGDATVEIADVTHDSREAIRGVLFVAIRGMTSDGHDYVHQAVERGAAAACVEEFLDVPIPQLRVHDTRLAMARLAAAVHGEPSTHLRLVGVTGTNGKTTVTHLLESIALAAGLPVGLIGTIGARSGTRALEVRRTTPESTDLQRMLAAMMTDGIDVVAMEVSSHALALHRVDATHFTVGAFTNLSQDHLDFHGTMEEYFAAKAALFSQAEHAVINVDSSWGRRLAELVEVPKITVGDDGDIRFHLIETTRTGSRFATEGLGLDDPISLPIPGRFNVANAVVAAAIARVLDVDPVAIRSGLERAPLVAGRFEPVPHDRGFGVIVDYAHTPEGIELAIDAARGIVGEGRVIVVVGAGGDRDRSKRPLMGAAAARADLIWVTSDNPRNEDPAGIIADVVQGLPSGLDVRIEADREKAIFAAIAQARPGDTVLILGKGHEQGQDLGDRVIPFDDRQVALAALEGRPA